MTRKRTPTDAGEQYRLDFSSAQGELMATLRMLRDCDLGFSRGRSEGIVELLERLAILGNDLREHDGRIVVRAHCTALAARITARRFVSDRTIRNWRRDAEAIGVLSVDVRSHSYGRREWNVFEIHCSRIREIIRARTAIADSSLELVADHGDAADCPQSSPGSERPTGDSLSDFATSGSELPTAAADASTGSELPTDEASRVGGNGRKWAETVSAPRAEMISAPRPEMVSGPQIEGNTRREQQQRPEPEGAGLVVVVSSCGVVMAERAIEGARELGLSDAEILERVERFRELERRNLAASPEKPPPDPGYLFRWLTVRGSYRSELAKEQSEAPRRRPSRSLADLAESARFRLIRTYRIDAARDWPPERCLAEYRSRTEPAGVA